MKRTYRNKKTGIFYKKIYDAIDATKERAGLSVIVFCPVDNHSVIYIQEREEFYKKFEPVQLIGGKNE